MEQNTKKKISKAVTAAAAGIALTVMVGQITPVNLINFVCDSSSYSDDQLFAAQECCGPYQQCQCPSFKGAS
ncbi:MAG: hypothetical protein H6Q66_2698 [Firmicutes bacterium]|nr:hypothetical protein [Bacillota bacterium]